MDGRSAESANSNFIKMDELTLDVCLLWETWTSGGVKCQRLFFFFFSALNIFFFQEGCSLLHQQQVVQERERERESICGNSTNGRDKVGFRQGGRWRLEVWCSLAWRRAARFMWKLRRHTMNSLFFFLSSSHRRCSLVVFFLPCPKCFLTFIIKRSFYAKMPASEHFGHQQESHDCRASPCETDWKKKWNSNSRFTWRVWSRWLYHLDSIDYRQRLVEELKNQWCEPRWHARLTRSIDLKSARRRAALLSDWIAIQTEL